MVESIEREIIKRLSKSDKEISNALGFSKLGTKNRIHRLFKKLGARNRTQALVIALLDGVIKLEEVQL